MPNWTENDIKKEFQRAKDNGWIAQFKKSAAEYEVPPELLMAVASRETNMRNVVGDGGHGSARVGHQRPWRRFQA